MIMDYIQTYDEIKQDVMHPGGSDDVLINNIDVTAKPFVSSV